MDILKRLKNNKIRNASKDVFLNIVANTIPVIILQFLVQPIVANKLGAERNGLFITIIALMHLIVVITGSSLNNSRLLLDRKYKKKQVSGDFNLYLLLLGAINIIIIIIGLIFYVRTLSSIEIITISILSLIWMIKDYLIVEFRINLDYKKILTNNFILSLGYIVGLFVFTFIPYWHVIFIIGYVLAFSHILFTSKLIKEPFVKTSMFSTLNKTVLVIITANFLGMISTNFDRLVLYPLVGGTLISIYYSASLIGKMMTLLSVPLSSVFLSYIVKYDSLPIKWLNYITGGAMILGTLLYFLFIFISPYLLGILYPKWYNESMTYIPIVTAAAIFELAFAAINPIVMHFCNINYQIRIQLIFIVCYVIFGLGLLYINGMIGFAYGVLIATSIKMLYVYISARKILKN